MLQLFGNLMMPLSRNWKYINAIIEKALKISNEFTMYEIAIFSLFYFTIQVAIKQMNLSQQPKKVVCRFELIYTLDIHA